MKKITTVSALLIALLFSASSVFAWSGHHGGKNRGDSDRRGEGMTYEQHEERMENRLERMAVILDLTEKQKEQLEDLHEKNWQDRQTMRAQMQESRNELHEHKFGKEFNETEFRAKAQKHSDLKTEIMVQRAQHKQNAYAVLTPEQQVKAEKLRDMRGEGFFGKHGGDPERDGYGKRNGNRECDGHGKRGSKGSGQRYNN